MALEFSICEVRWERYPRVSENAHARDRPKTCVARKIHAHSRLAEMQVVADHRWSAGPDCFRVVLARRFLSQNGRQTERTNGSSRKIHGLAYIGTLAFQLIVVGFE
jgi:hypothetical protein